MVCDSPIIVVETGLAGPPWMRSSTTSGGGIESSVGPTTISVHSPYSGAVTNLQQIDVESLRTRAVFDESQVAHYAKTLDEAPPILVYDTECGRVLVEGHHRVIAARRLQRTTIKGELRSGTYAESLNHQDLTPQIMRSERCPGECPDAGHSHLHANPR
jgi:hypothetical protein